MGSGGGIQGGRVCRVAGVEGSSWWVCGLVAGSAVGSEGGNLDGRALGRVGGRMVLGVLGASSLRCSLQS